MTTRERVLIAEDDNDLAELLAEELTDAGFDVCRCDSTEAAIPRLHEFKPELVVSDLRLPGADGMELLAHCRQCNWQPAFLVITAFGTISQAVEALKAGADEFLAKPLSMDHLLITVRKLLDNRLVRSEVNQYRRLLSADNLHGLFGESRAMKTLGHQIQQIGPADGPVLVLGESGTGKELVAKAIHAESQRAAGPFVAVNCAGIPTELMESEFFGHAAGAFTGARTARSGLFSQANGGTLLLDEIAEMPIPLQAKLLRVLQEGTVRRVGEDTETPVDVRIIAATHQDLGQCITEGRFRQDLYYRLETFTLQVPPLRERGEDILRLAKHFLRQSHQPKDPPIEGFTPEAEQLLRHYQFPGNVRELQNAVERGVAFCDQKRIDRHHLPQRMLQAATETKPLPSVSSRLPPVTGPSDGNLPSLSEVQQHYVRHVMEQTGGNKRQAAMILGVTRRTLYRWLAEDETDPS